jgi:hypothetical protein
MKKIFTISIFTFLFSCALIAQENRIAWDYPVKPGTEEWAAFTTKAQMLEACQIPQIVLDNINTTDLVELCLNYPLLFDFYAYNNIREGIINVAEDFNGLQELFGREDNAQHLFEILEEKNNTLRSNTDTNTTWLQLGELIVKQSLLEALLFQELVMVNTTAEQQKEIADVALQNMIIKKQMPELYSTQSLEASAYLLCASLKKINSGEALTPDLEIFLNTGSLQHATLIDEIQNYYDILTE